MTPKVIHAEDRAAQAKADLAGGQRNLHRPFDLVEQFAQFADALPAYRDALRADIAAVIDRDPACDRAIEPILYFKGFHAIRNHTDCTEIRGRHLWE